MIDKHTQTSDYVTDYSNLREMGAGQASSAEIQALSGAQKPQRS
jgi:hypothetical protein